MSAGERLARRRARARELRSEGLSVRQIGRELGVGATTVFRDLAAVVPEVEHRPAPLAAAPPGNLRAVSHGCWSETSIAPAREAHARDLAERYPDLDPGRRAVEAQRRAMIQLASDWIDRAGTVVRGELGQTYDIAVKLAAWLTASERWIQDAESARREKGRASLRSFIEGSEAK